MKLRAQDLVVYGWACLVFWGGPSTPASAQDAPQGEVLPVADDAAMSSQARLEQAVRYYQLGERDEARRLLAALVVTPDLAADLRQESRVYLAELLMVEGDVDRARDFLEQVLVEDPAFTIDLFRHTPEVAGEFDYVKALRFPVPPAGDSAPAVEPVLVTMPMSVWNPFGRYHFTQGRPVRGLVYFAGFTTSAVTSGFLWGFVHADRRYRVGLSARQTTDERQLRNLRRVQWVATGACYGFWATSVVDARLHWRKVGMKASVQPSVTRTDTGDLQGVLAIRGTF